MPKRSHLYSYHERNGRMVEFAGYSMPLWYKGISEEHLAVRNSAGLFDVSHMGRFLVQGPDSYACLNHLLPSELAKLQEGGATYSVLCNEEGGIVDDVVVLRLSPERFLMIVNAANIEKDFSWITRHSTGYRVELADETGKIALLALQGPLAKPILEALTGADLRGMKRFTHRATDIDGARVILSRTGYTGEDGFELLVLDSPVSDPEKAENVWDRILSEYGSRGVLPCGLGARDTLRLEAGLCLYGQDIDETTGPFEANLGWLVSLEKKDFVGKAALEARKGNRGRRRMGLEMEAGGIPRHGCEVLIEGRPIGTVTSGTFSPLLKKGIAMGYLPEADASPGGRVEVSIRAKRWPAMITNPPFYDTQRYGWRRTA